jgi:SNF2 family DNA or RNA helicase
MSTVTESGARVDLVALVRAALEHQVNAGEVTYLYLAGSNCWIGLPQERVVKISRILLDLTNLESEDTPPRISRFDLGTVADLDSADNIRVVGGEDIKELARRLAAPLDPLPEAAISALQKPLRPYQAEGVQWLRTRKAVGVGAIVGDEMGVGKTLQVLCSLWMDICDGQSEPSIVILPKTLVGKWQDEQRQFIPDMNLVQITSVAHIDKLTSLRPSDVVVTTYGALVEHSEKFASRAWNIVPCDEAHLYLSNPKTATHRAVKQLKANQVLPITGTPLQNKPSDLWALMDLCVPGLLRSHRWFRQQFVSIEKGRGALPPEEVIFRRRLLGRMTSPFRLARKNKDVGNQLPKINVVERYLDMEPAQRDVYETVRASMNQEVRVLLAKSGLAKNQISVLAAINRLRQVCCSPALLKGVKAAARAPSVKMDEIRRIASELNEEDRQLVIVSEWAEMLGLVAKSLDGIGISHVTLTGKSGSIAKRNDVISSFRSKQVRVLLMTLTVGGVGLDLPEASVMVFCENWWNPAKMAQAAARMTRDDSKTHVTAIHLLVRGSLEEGVKAIAERKGEMIESILGGDSVATSGSLTEEDIEQLLRPLPLAA